jgi:tRNA A-37 threonylcarbamoyl transferase component Bud32
MQIQWGGMPIRTTLNSASEVSQKIASFCSQIAGSAQIVAISIFDCHDDSTDRKGAIEVILVILDFQPRLMSFTRALNGRSVVIFAIDQWIFERDIERGFLGEATVGTLVFPHAAIIGNEYLLSQEIKLKKRLILELLENLVIGFPELARQMRIKPEYFLYETMLSRIRVFPPLAYSTGNIVDNVERNKSAILDTYNIALRQLEQEKKILFSNNYIMITREFLPKKNIPRKRLSNLSKTAPRTFFTSFFEMFPQLLNFFAESTKRGFGLQRLQLGSREDETTFVDPQRYIFVPTANGLVSLSDRISVEEFARKVLLKGEKGKITLEPIGGVLNDVYLAEARLDSEKKKLLIKRFKDWSGIKWFPLNIWALGARSFAVLGRARLEREIATSELLRKEGFYVPRILHVSHGKGLVFMEYIDGQNLSFTLRKLATRGSREKAENELAIISKVGETLSRVHSINVALGDTKPENVLIDQTGKIYLIDFEQASTEGDKAWDVAEFLYYSGHYLSPLRGNDDIQAFARTFVDGYLKAGGDPAVIRKASAPKYTRVFSLFTMPKVILAISDTCKNIN